MPKIHYLGFTKSRRPIGRVSTSDFGYRFAAVSEKRGGIPSFSKTAAGALNNIGKTYAPTAEVVEVKVVTSQEYRVAFKAAAGTLAGPALLAKSLRL
jgi:hypothetical protein